MGNVLSFCSISKNVKIKTYTAVILPFVLCGCEEHRLRLFENRLLRRIFGPKRQEVTKGWNKLHNGKLHDLCTSSKIIIRVIKSRRMRW
jgi:hypothetical protein